MSDISVLDTRGEFELCEIFNDTGNIVGYCIRCAGLASPMFTTLAEAQAIFDQKTAGYLMSKAAALAIQHGGLASIRSAMGDIPRPLAAEPERESAKIGNSDDFDLSM